MSDPISADKCRDITDQTKRTICEVCQPDEQGHIVIPTDRGERISNSKEGCAYIIPLMLAQGYKLLIEGRSRSADSTVPPPVEPLTTPPKTKTSPQVQPKSRFEPAPAQQPQPQPQPQPAPEPQPQPRPPDSNQNNTVENTSANEDKNRPTSDEGKIVKPFVAQIIPDGRTTKVSRTMLYGKGKGCKLKIEYSAKPAGEPGSYLLTYSIYKDDTPFEIAKELKFKTRNGRTTLGIELIPFAQDLYSFRSIKIVDMNQ